MSRYEQWALVSQTQCVFIFVAIVVSCHANCSRLRFSGSNSQGFRSRTSKVMYEFLY
jgi:hypothetical protein